MKGASDFATSQPALLLVEVNLQSFHPGEARLCDAECSVQGQLHERIVFDAKRAGDFAEGFELLAELEFGYHRTP